MKKSFTEDTLYKRAIARAESEGKRKPDTVSVQMVIPIDCYEAFIRRYYEEYADLKFQHTKNRVTKSDIVSTLMWLFGMKYDEKFSSDVLRHIDPNISRPARTGRPSNNPAGRPPRKHLLDLFEGESDSEATEGPSGPSDGK